MFNHLSTLAQKLVFVQDSPETFLNTHPLYQFGKFSEGGKLTPVDFELRKQ
jgi:hypothetical protein